MKFDKEDITILESLNEAEAKAYILFLLSERRRHVKDIVFTDERIKKVIKKFGFELPLE